MSERLVPAAGALLCIETFGEAADPALLLIAGGAQSMVWWEDDFCRRLAAGGRFVVRYDHRDTGRSATSPAGHPSYTGEDLATDPLRLMDSLDVAAAHLVGLSMGGGIAQWLAVTSPERVRTLTLMSTSPAVAEPGPPLPGPEPRLAATFTDPEPEPDWADRDAVLAYRVEIERPYAGSLGFDEARTRVLAKREIDRTVDMAASLTNHFLVDDDWPPGAALADIAAPTLVIHGTSDPLFPLPHGQSLARRIPGARLLELDGVGHQQPPPERWDVVIDALLEHTRPARA